MSATELDRLTPRLRDKIETVPATGCWKFCGCTAKTGYGRVWGQAGRADWAHRVYYQALRGPIPTGLVIDHLCRNRWCVNPEHLDVVTDGENTRRGVSPEATRARHKRRTHCKRGHPLFGANVYQGPHRRARICKTCQQMHGREYTRRRRQPSRVLKPIETPHGRFPSASEAARALGMTVSTVTHRARRQMSGWRYLSADVLLALANPFTCEAA